MRRVLTLALMALVACRDFDGEYERRAAREDGGAGGGATAGGSTGGGSSAGGGTAGGGSAGGGTAGGGSAGGGTAGGGSAGGGTAGGNAPCGVAYCPLDERSVGGPGEMDCTGAAFTSLDALSVFCRGANPNVRVTVGSDGGLQSAATNLFLMNWVNADGPADDLWVTNYAYLYRSKNGGNLVQQLDVCGVGSAYSVYSPAPGEAWVGGDTGKVCHLLPDGGFQSLQVPGVISNVYAVFAADGEVLIGTEAGTLYRKDGTLEFTAGESVNMMHGTDLAHVWAVTNDKLLLERRLDGGWAQVVMGTGALYDVRAFSSTDVWAAGPYDVLHRTAGGSWATVSLTTLGVSNLSPIGVRGDATSLLLYGQSTAQNAMNHYDGRVIRLRRGP